jgi:aminomethyltransferase
LREPVVTASIELRRTPLHPVHRAAGARLVEFAGWEMPVQYAGVIAEHQAVRSAAGLFDVSHMGQLEVRGAGAESFLQRLTPNDVVQLQPGRAHYSGLLTEEGGYVDDLLVYRLAADRFLLVVNAANRDEDFVWVASRAPRDVVVEDVSDGWALLALQGPRAAPIVQALSDLDLARLKYYRFAEGRVAGRPALVSRTGYTGEDGFELYVAPVDAVELWQALLAAGEPHGLTAAGLGARDTLRLEAGMALYGHELDRTTTPWEAGLDWVVKLDKGAFVGREALARQRERGRPRALIGFEVLERGIARHGHGVVVEGRECGRVTSGTWSPTLDRAIGMAYLPTEHAAVGREIAVDVRGRRLAARVVQLPFYRRGR